MCGMEAVFVIVGVGGQVVYGVRLGCVCGVETVFVIVRVGVKGGG